MERRQATRAPTRVTIGCRVPSTPTLANVMNLSVSGCMLESNEPCIMRGSTILLSFPGVHEVAGEVLWQKAKRFGVKFNSSFDEGVLVTLLSRQQRSAEPLSVTDSFGRILPPL